MSYEEDYRKPYRAKCACGQGFLRYYKVYLSNDWGQEKKNDTPVEIVCVDCESKYHYENTCGHDYLVPNGLTFPTKEPHLDRKFFYDDKEKIIEQFDRNDIEAIITDMTAPKRRFIKNLSTKLALKFADIWYSNHGKKSLAPMISYLQSILDEFDAIKESYDQKTVFRNRYIKECEDYSQLLKQIEEQSFRLNFQYDSEQDELERITVKRERERREEEHKFDDFTAEVHYDSSFRKDLVNHYWDSFLIKECTDSQYLLLNKQVFGMPQIMIAKKYLCVCQICGKEEEIISSNFKISHNDERGYYPEACCSCHTVSSFEAKTMEILNQLGITYIREKSFIDLVGDTGRVLRFDFALYKSDEGTNIPQIDLIIELQGPHHYKKGYYDEFGDYITEDIEQGLSKSVEDNFERQCRYDEKKREYCLKHGINLECIKYTASSDYEQLERKIIAILQKYGYRYFVENIDNIFN